LILAALITVNRLIRFFIWGLMIEKLPATRKFQILRKFVDLIGEFIPDKAGGDS